jgi:hypothetical protein
VARTPSTMLSWARWRRTSPLPDVDGGAVSLSDYRGSPLLVMFICNHCPFVKHVRHELARLGSDYIGRGLGIVAISSNDAEAYPADGPAAMRQEKTEAGYPFPICTTKRKRRPQRTGPRARRISSCSMRITGWCIAGSLMAAGRATTCR